MELRTIDMNKKYGHLLIKYIHFDEYGSEYYSEEVTRLNELIEQYNPVSISGYILVDIIKKIKTIFRDNEENYLHVELENTKESYAVNYYSEELGTYSHTTNEGHYSINYDPINGYDIKTSAGVEQALITAMLKDDMRTIDNLGKMKPLILTPEEATIIGLYQAFYSKKPDFMDVSTLMEVVKMASQTNKSLGKDKINLEEITDNYNILQIIEKLKLFVAFTKQEQKLIQDAVPSNLVNDINQIKTPIKRELKNKGISHK